MTAPFGAAPDCRSDRNINGPGMPHVETQRHRHALSRGKVAGQASELDRGVLSLGVERGLARKELGLQLDVSSRSDLGEKSRA